MSKNRATSYGKGDNPRHLKSKKKFDEEWDRIFGYKVCSLNHMHSDECLEKFKCPKCKSKFTFLKEIDSDKEYACKCGSKLIRHKTTGFTMFLNNEE
jgi:DNA-directed RNA polymerase subunit RPC12/RpoP